MSPVLFVGMATNKLFALTLVLPIALAGCLGGHAEEPQVPLDAAVPVSWNWTTDSFRWVEAIDGNAAARIVASGPGPYDCTLGFDHAPTASVPGWDAAVVIRSEKYQSWVYTGSAWHDARVYAGPVDTADLVEPYRDEGRYPLDWPIEGVTGELEIFVVALHLKAGGTPNFDLSVKCDGAGVASAAIGRDAVLFGAASGPDGVGANAHALVVGPAAAVTSGGSVQMVSADTWLFVTGYSDSVAMVTVDGEGSQSGGVYFPDPWGILDEEASYFVDVGQVGGPGTYTYQMTEASPYGVHAGLIGVTPLVRL